jgi:hypothetical protein
MKKNMKIDEKTKFFNDLELLLLNIQNKRKSESIENQEYMKNKKIKISKESNKKEINIIEKKEEINKIENIKKEINKIEETNKIEEKKNIEILEMKKEKKKEKLLFENKNIYINESKYLSKTRSNNLKEKIKENGIFF